MLMNLSWINVQYVRKEDRCLTKAAVNSRVQPFLLVLAQSITVVRTQNWVLSEQSITNCSLPHHEMEFTASGACADNHIIMNVELGKLQKKKKKLFQFYLLILTFIIGL